MSITKKKLSVVILTYNSSNTIEKCLKTLLKEKGIDFEIIVIDNHSDDNSINKANKFKVHIKVEKNTKNVGFSKGVNKGIKKSTGEYILLLNPDTIIPNGAINKLFDCQNSSGAEVIGGRAVKINGLVHNTFVKKPSLMTLIFDYTNLRKLFPFDLIHKSHYYLNKKYPDHLIDVDAVSGGYMLVKREVFTKVGLFDENFFMYLEDIDFCVRAKQFGYRVCFCPYSTIIHIGGASSNNPDKINHVAWGDSRRYYLKKHFSQLANALITPIFTLDDIINSIWRKIRLR
jgi:GT2 family glycosyltransferase